MAKYKNNLQSAICNLQSKAFTIVELLVAMSLLVMLLALSGMVFSTTVKAHRAGGAAIDVSRNLRAITDQLNIDFRGLQKDAPLMFWFTYDPAIGRQFDATHFFADGDFQTVIPYKHMGASGLYDDIVHGNMARVYYGHANSSTGIDYNNQDILARRSHILTASQDLISMQGWYPNLFNAGNLDYSIFPNSATSRFMLSNENFFEFDTIAPNEWLNVLNFLTLPASSPNNADYFINTILTDAGRPMIDLSNPGIPASGRPWLLSQGVLGMRIQWAYTPSDLAGALPGFSGVRWWPSADPDGQATYNSDFDTMLPPPATPNDPRQLGIFFALPNGVSNTTDSWFAIAGCGTSGVLFKDTFYPKALKFTLVLRDSNGVFAEGKTFTHIVYIDN